MSLWYFSVNGKAEGPVGEDVILDGLRSGRFTLVDLVFREGQQGWCTLGEVEKFREAYKANPIPQPPAPVAESVKAILEKVDDRKTPATGNAKASVDQLFSSVLPKAQRPSSQDSSPVSRTTSTHSTPPAAPSGSKPHWSTEPAWVILKSKADGGFEQTGPYSVVQILEMIATGEVKYSHYSWRPGYKRWVRIGNLPEFDRRKRDREGDPVNQIIPLPDQAQNVPALSREDLMGQIERLRRPASRMAVLSHERPPEAVGQDLAKLPYEVPDQQEVTKPSIAPQPHLPPTPSQTVASKPVPPPAPQVVEQKPVEPVKLEQKTEQVSEMKPKLVGGADQPKPVAQMAPLEPLPETRKETPQPAEELNPAQLPVEEVPRKRSVGGRVARLGFAALVSTVAVIAFFEYQSRNEVKPASEESPKDLASKAVEPVSKNSVPQPVEPAPQPNAADPVTAAQAPVEPVSQPAPPVAKEESPSSSLGVRAMAPSNDVPKVLEIIPLKMTSQPTLVFQTDAGVSESIEVKILGRSGDILDLPAYFERFTVKRTAGEIATLDLGTLALPRGTYRAIATVGALQDESTFFIGVRDASFETIRSAHLKKISSQQVRERRALYYGSIQMERVATQLVDGYKRHRVQPKKWAQFYAGWLASARTSVKDVLSLKTEVAEGGKLAFPVEVAAFQKATERLGAQAREFDLSVTQKRQLAAAPEVVGADFKRIREELAEFTAHSP